MHEQASSGRPPTDAPDSQWFACRRCGYDLRGLSADALCPECALPVVASTGNYLAHADPLWVARLKLAAALGVASAMVTLLTWTPNLFPTSMSRLPRCAHVIVWATSTGTLLALLSAWLLATPEDDERRGTFTLIRRALRATTIASLTLHVLGLDHWSNWDDSRIYLFTVPLSMALDIAGTIFFYLYLWRLGKLLPDPFLIRHSLLVMAGMIFLSVLSRVVPALLVWFDSTDGGYRPPPVPPLAQGLVASAVLVYTLLLERQAYLAFTAAAAAARENWVRRPVQSDPPPG